MGKGAHPASPQAESCPQPPLGNSAPVSRGWAAPDPSFLAQDRLRATLVESHSPEIPRKPSSDAARLQDGPGTKCNCFLIGGRLCQPRHLPGRAHYPRGQRTRTPSIFKSGLSRCEQGESSPDLQSLVTRPLC